MPLSFSRRNLALSLVEVLVALGIILVVVAILLPVVSRAKRSAHITDSMSNLRQIGLALALYRDTTTAATDFGAYTAMGLPENPDVLELPSEIWLCDDRGADSIGGLILMYTNQPRTESWEEYTARVGDSAIAVADMCWENPPGTLFDNSANHFGLGVYLDTHVTRRRGAGDWIEFSWWD